VAKSDIKLEIRSLKRVHRLSRLYRIKRVIVLRYRTSGNN